MHTSAASSLLLAADSFRVRVHDGVTEARSFGAHLDRFRSTVAEQFHAHAGHAARQGSAGLPDLAGAAAAALFHPDTEARASVLHVSLPQLPESEALALEAFLLRARHEIAAYGAGFPRLECWLDPAGSGAAASGAPGPTLRFEVALRPLPPLGNALELATQELPAPPLAHVKGPNIARYSELNRAAGCEALLVDASGEVREGATTSLIVWTSEEDDSGLRLASSARVASVTEAALGAAAAERLVGVKPNRKRTGALNSASLSVADLRHAEVWAVNALHGIRLVTAIDGTPLTAPRGARLRWFAAALDRTWEPVA